MVEVGLVEELMVTVIVVKAAADTVVVGTFGIVEITTTEL